MRTSFRRSVAILVLAAVAAGASVATATARRDADPVTLTMLMASSQQPGMSILIANFERVYPNIHINVTYIPSSNLSPLLLTQFQAGNAPDLFHMLPGYNGTTGVLVMAKGARLLPLDKEIWVQRMPAYVKPAVLLQNKVYAYPYALYAIGVAYNKPLFNQLGLKIPTTFAQVLSMCKKIVAAGKIPFVQPFGDLANAALFPEQRMMQYVYSKNKNWDDLRDQKKVSFATSPDWRRAFQTIYDMRDAGCFQPAPQATSTTQAFASFVRGDAVMELMASTQFGNVTALDPNFKAGFYNLPGDTAKQQAISLSGSFIGINGQTKHPAEAKDFIHFLSRPKQAALFAKISGGNSYYDLGHGVLPPYMSDLLPLLKSGKALWARHTQWPNPSLIDVVLRAGTQGLFTGQRTIDDLLKTADYLWDNPTATSGP